MYVIMDPKNEKVDEDKLLSCIIMSRCLKKCLNKKNISFAVKTKIMHLLYEDSHLFVKPSSLDEIGDNMNPLGIDEDLLDAQPDLLTADQIDLLKQIIKVEMRKYLKQCSSMKSQIVEASDKPYLQLIEQLYAEHVLETQSLEVNSNLQKDVKVLEHDICSFSEVLKNHLYSRVVKLFHDERSLLENIDKAITSGEKGTSLDKLERQLEQTINEKKELITKLKLRLSEHEDVAD